MASVHPQTLGHSPVTQPVLAATAGSWPEESIFLVIVGLGD